MDWAHKWFETAKQVVFSPTAFFEQSEPADIGGSMAFAVTSLLVSGLISFLLFVVLSLGFAAPEPMMIGIRFASAIFAAAIGGTIGILIGAGLIHIFVYLLGGRGYEQTVDVVGRSTAVQAFFGWIPLVNVLASIYTLYVQVVGIKNRHNFSTGRAVAAVLLPLIILLGVAILIIAMFVTTPMMTPEMMSYNSP